MIENPILPGFHPDPSACQHGEDYYIATSTFEWWPGIMIYHSRDLATWELAAQPVKDLDFFGDESSGGLWAPHLTWADGKFWLIVTDMKTRTGFKDSLNYLTTCETIDGEWSKPQYLNSSGFDPALFHDDDGRKYLLNMLWDFHPERPSFAGIVMQEYDPARGALVGKRAKIFDVTSLGVAEGPQILKKDGWYYLLTAAGGTSYGHAAVVARSRSVWGPYEVSPYHPLLTSANNPDNPLQKAGHASFLQFGGEWFITHLCSRPLTTRGRCPLGRETALQRVEWVDDWPRLSGGSQEPALHIPEPAGRDTVQDLDHSFRCDFHEARLPMAFQSLRGSLGRYMTLTERSGYLRLYGGMSLASIHRQSLVAVRWQSFRFRAETRMEFSPTDFQKMAGLVCLYDSENWMYAYLSRGMESGRPELNVMVSEGTRLRMECQGVEVPENIPLHLVVEVDHDRLQFQYSLDRQEWHNLGPALPADRLSDDFIEQNFHMVFTGAFVGLCCQDLNDQTAYADFDYFSYMEL